MINFGFTTSANTATSFKNKEVLGFKEIEIKKGKKKFIVIKEIKKLLDENFWDDSVGAIDAPDFIPCGSSSNHGEDLLHRELHVPYEGLFYPPVGWDRLFYSKTSMNIFFDMMGMKTQREKYLFIKKFLRHEERTNK